MPGAATAQPQLYSAAQMRSYLDNVVRLAFGLSPVCICSMRPAGQHLKLGMQHIHLGLAVTQLKCDPAAFSMCRSTPNP